MSEPRLSDMMGGGWDGLRAIEEAATGVRGGPDAPQDRLAEQALRAFSTDSGKAVLEHLLDRTVRRAPVPDLGHPGALGLTLEQVTAAVVWHQAQCALVRDLVALMEEGAREP